MITTRLGSTKIKGTKVEIRADFMAIAKSYKQVLTETGMTEEEAVDSINECVEVALLTEEEAEDMMEQTEKEIRKTQRVGT